MSSGFAILTLSASNCLIFSSAAGFSDADPSMSICGRSLNLAASNCWIFSSAAGSSSDADPSTSICGRLPEIWAFLASNCRIFSSAAGF